MRFKLQLIMWRKRGQVLPCCVVETAESLAAETSKLEVEKPTSSEEAAEEDHAINVDQEENYTTTEKVQKSSNIVNMNAGKAN